MSRSIKFLALTFSEGLNVLVGFLFLPYLARAMEVVDYGTYGQTLLVVDLAKGLFALGLAKVIFSFLAKENYDQSEVLISNIWIAFFSGIAGGIIITSVSPILAQDFENPIITQLIWIYALAMPFQLIYSSINSSLIFFDRIKQSAVIAVVSNLIRVILIVVAVQFFYSLKLIFVSLIIVAFIQILLSFFQLPKILRSNIFSPNWRLGLTQIKIGWPLGFASILGVAFWTIDGIMVSSMLDVKQYAIYKNGAFQIPFISSIYGAITAILLPDVSKYFFKKQFDKIIHLKKRVITNTAMLIIPTVIFCIIFAEPLIVTYLSERYVLSAKVFMIYNLILLVRFTSYDDLFIATDNNRFMPPIYIIALIINGILNFLLIQLWGIEGAAIASVISFYILVIWLFNKGTSFINAKPVVFLELKKLFYILFISFSFSILFRIAGYFISLNAISLLLILFVYYIIIYHIVITQKLIEKRILENLLSKQRIFNPVLNFLNKYY